MFHCAQLNAHDVVTTIARLTDVVEAPHIVPIDESSNVLGWKYDRATNRFYRLVVSASAASTTVNVPVVVVVRWLDENDVVVPDESVVSIVVNDVMTTLTMTVGEGEFDFVADTAGVYRIETSSTGVFAFTEVTVA